MLRQDLARSRVHRGAKAHAAGGIAAADDWRAAQARRPRVLFLIDGLGWGGAEHLLTLTLPALRDAGFAPRVGALQVRNGNPAGVALTHQGIPVDLVPLDRLRNIHQAGALYLYIRRQGCDIVHTTLEASTVYGTLAARVLGLPAFCTLHTAEEPIGGARRRAALLHFALRRYGGTVLCVSEHVRRHYIERFGFPPNRLIVLYNGIDLAPFEAVAPEARARVRAELAIPRTAPVVVTVAVLRPPKGIATMIEAMPAVLRAHPEARYLVVGDGETRGELEALARRHAVAERVVFAGARTDIPDILAAADAFVLPSLNEALPTVLVEAMAAAKPIIASSTGGIPEMVESGVNGVLVPPGAPGQLAAACIRLLAAPEWGAAMGARGRRIACTRFALEAHAARLVTLYEAALDRREGRCGSPS